MCGSETISTVSSAKKEFIFGFAVGTPSTMDDATRFYTINEATFAPWFAISPTNDPCTVNNYELIVPQQTLSGIIIQETQILLTGTLGSFVLKVDRTKQTGIRSVHLKARTRGLNTIQQEI